MENLEEGNARGGGKRTEERIADEDRRKEGEERNGGERRKSETGEEKERKEGREGERKRERGNLALSPPTTAFGLASLASP